MRVPVFGLSLNTGQPHEEHNMDQFDSPESSQQPVAPNNAGFSASLPSSPGANSLPATPNVLPVIQYAPQPPKNRGTALVLEILLGLFGLPGFGWIYSGQTTGGVILLVCYLAWDVIAIIIDLASGGFACLCTLPVNVVTVTISSILLNSHMRQHPETFGT